MRRAGQGAIAGMLFEYLESGHVHPIWLDNFISFYCRNDVVGMGDFVGSLDDPVLFLQLYQAACRHTTIHGKFYLTAEKHLLKAAKPILLVLQFLVSSGQYDYSNPLYMNALKIGSETFDAETEKAAVLLATAVLKNKDDNQIKEFMCSIVRNQAKHPNSTDYRRLCFVQQVSIETGLMMDEIECIGRLLPPRSKYACFKLLADNVTLEDIIQEISHYDLTKHECVHECYND